MGSVFLGEQLEGGGGKVGKLRLVEWSICARLGRSDAYLDHRFILAQEGLCICTGARGDSYAV